MKKKITYETIAAMVPLVPENIYGEAATQTDKFLDVVRWRVDKLRRRNRAKGELETRRLMLAVKIRRKQRAEKLTEAALKERVEVQPSVRGLRAAYDEAVAWEELGSLMIDVFKMRRDSVRIIAEAQTVEGMRGTREIEKLESTQRLRKRALEAQMKRSRLGEED